MRIVDVLYDDYALVHTIKTKAEVSDVVNELLSKSGLHSSILGKLCIWIQDFSNIKATHSVIAGRTQEASVALQETFKQFSLDTGILPDNIVTLPKNSMSLM